MSSIVKLHRVYFKKREKKLTLAGKLTTETAGVTKDKIFHMYEDLQVTIFNYCGTFCIYL